MPGPIAARSVVATAALIALLCLTGCDEQAAAPPYLAALNEPDIIRAEDPGAPPNARPGSCWGRDVTPAIVETVTEQIMVQPPEVLADGTVLTPGIFRTEQQQRIVQERRETWFDPLPAHLDCRVHLIRATCPTSARVVLWTNHRQLGQPHTSRHPALSKGRGTR